MCSDLTIVWYISDLNQKLNWILVTLALYWLGIRLIINLAVSHTTTSCSFLWRTVPPAAKQRALRWGGKKTFRSFRTALLSLLVLIVSVLLCVRACECVCERAFGSLWLFLPCWVVFSSGCWLSVLYTTCCLFTVYITPPGGRIEFVLACKT